MPNIQANTPKSPVRRFLEHPLWAPLNQRDAWSRLATGLNPAWSLTETRARVLRVVDEAPGVRSLWLQPNRRFKGFRPGQHVLLELEVNGARHGRCFSFSHAPRPDGLLRLTIKQKADGPVSTAAHALVPGDVVRLGEAQGAFAPGEGKRPLLLIAAGSGITPMVSLLQALAAAEPARDVVLLQCGRTESDLIFAEELSALCHRMPGFARLAHVSGRDGRLDAATLVRRVPDWTRRELLLCGPDGFMTMVEALHAAEGRGQPLRTESFGRRAAPVDPDALSHAVAWGGHPPFRANVGQSLLDAAEAAGLKPRFGCRRGICRSCQCTKRSGTVLNLLTGQLSGPGEELIQPCISTPQGAVEMAS